MVNHLTSGQHMLPLWKKSLRMKGKNFYKVKGYEIFHKPRTTLRRPIKTIVQEWLLAYMAWSDLQLFRDIFFVLATQGWQKIVDDGNNNTFVEGVDVSDSADENSLNAIDRPVEHSNKCVWDPWWIWSIYFICFSIYFFVHHKVSCCLVEVFMHQIILISRIFYAFFPFSSLYQCQLQTGANFFTAQPQ